MKELNRESSPKKLDVLLSPLKSLSTTWRPAPSLSAEQLLNYTQKVEQSINQPSGEDVLSISLGLTQRISSLEQKLLRIQR